MSCVCTDCGACCANFRVSFYWGEMVPDEFTVPISPYLAAMKGTEQNPVRCCALQGEIGQSVSCAIYNQRSSTCREVSPGDDKCNRARLAHGLTSTVSLDGALNELS